MGNCLACMWFKIIRTVLLDLFSGCVFPNTHDCGSRVTDRRRRRRSLPA